MNRKFMLPILALLFIPSIVFAWTDTSHMDGTYPYPGGNWACIDAPPAHGEVASDSTTPDPSTVLKLTYPKGFENGSYAAKCWNIPPQGVLKEYWIQYLVKYSSNYNFHPVVDKQSYFMTDYPGGYRNNYFIGRWGDGHIVLENQGAENRNYFSNTGYNPTFQAGQWYKVTHHFKVNTVGQNNGIAEIWIDDQLVMSYSNLKVIDSNNTGIAEWQIAPVYGGMSGTFKPSEDYQYYDLTIFSTGPIGVPSSTVKSPMSPSRLQIQ